MSGSGAPTEDRIPEAARVASLGSKRRVGRFAHPWRVGVSVLVVAGLFVGAFLLGQQFQQPSWQHAQEAATALEIWAFVESRVVDDAATFGGVIKAGTTADVKAPALPAVAIVTRRGTAPGVRAMFGSLAAVISGDPYFLLPGPLPLYRDLILGSRGDDVAALQDSLRRTGYDVAVTGVVNERTVRAAQALFKTADFALPTTAAIASSTGTAASAPSKVPALSSVIPYRQLLTLPAEGMVTASADVAAAITADTALVTVRTSESYVEFVADVVSADRLKVGDPVVVRLQGGGGLVNATITTVGVFQNATESGAVAGKPVRVALAPGPSKQTVAAGQSVTVATQGTHEAGLAVPLTAVRQDASGPYVVAVRSSQSSPSTSPSPSASAVRVTVLRSADGWAAISGDVAVGDAVRVAP